jgi:hypothetical protein
MNERADPPDADASDLDALRAFPARDAEGARADVVRRQALRAFEVAHAHAGHPWIARGARVWSRVLVPAVLVATCAVYLTLALRSASALYQ